MRLKGFHIPAVETAGYNSKVLTDCGSVGEADLTSVATDFSLWDISFPTLAVET